MRQKKIKTSDILADPAILKVGARLFTTDEKRLGIQVITQRDCDDLGFTAYKPDGSILFVLLKGALLNVLSQKELDSAYELLRTVSGNLSNRPDIIGEKMRMPGIRKNGTASNFKMAPPAVVTAMGGNSDLLGFYKYKNPAPGVLDCAPTAWTIGKPNIYGDAQRFIYAVDEVYRTVLPDEHRTQMEYVRAIPPVLRIGKTAFTTLYILKNAPTAIHIDKFDYAKSFGVMATLGDWKGNAIVWPKYRIGVDYRPGDVLLGDVHEYHCNLPRLSGERVSCIFFVRTGMHQCPARGQTALRSK
jgi:hypothetical protein